ncbi:hypothetical protein Bbelb_254510 [Branchiostoma belcheri]|nr:hypothetical protein Bbelb_254510 [Branchiostoma belcheri]
MNMDASPVHGEYKCEIYRLYVQSVIRGVFEFAVNRMTNWLPTRTGQPGPLGKGHQSLRHVLNACPVSLTDRYTWRHNSVLKELVTTLQGWYLTLEAAWSTCRKWAKVSVAMQAGGWQITMKRGDKKRL